MTAPSGRKNNSKEHYIYFFCKKKKNYYRKLTSFTTSLHEANNPVSSAVLSISDFCKIAATWKKCHAWARFVYDTSTILERQRHCVPDDESEYGRYVRNEPANRIKQRYWLARTFFKVATLSSFTLKAFKAAERLRDRNFSFPVSSIFNQNDMHSAVPLSRLI